MAKDIKQSILVVVVFYAIVDLPINVVYGLLIYCPSSAYKEAILIGCNKTTLFVDGNISVPTNTEVISFSLVAKQYLIPTDLKTFAVHGKCSSDELSFGPNIFKMWSDSIEWQTNERWKCSTEYDVNWTLPTYRDHDWPRAVPDTKYFGSALGKPLAPWIRPKGNLETDIYCRLSPSEHTDNFLFNCGFVDF